MDIRSHSSERRGLNAGALLVLVAAVGVVVLLAWSAWLTVPIARGYLSGSFAADSRADFASNPSSRFAPQRAVPSTSASTAPAAPGSPGSPGSSSAVQSPP